MGNYGCTCSDFVKEESLYEKVTINEKEEVLEFQPDPCNHASKSLVTAVELPTSHDKCQTPIISNPSPEYNDFFADMQGEILKLEQRKKDLYISKWGVLFSKSFKYYRSQYSSLCKEKPLFEISTDNITSFNWYVKNNEFFFEISYIAKNKKQLGMSVNSSILSARGKNFREDVGHVKSKSISIKPEETITFAVTLKDDWVKWQRNFLGCVRIMG